VLCVIVGHRKKTTEMKETLLSTIGKMEANIESSQATVKKIGRLHISDWEIHSLKDSLARIQELLKGIEKGVQDA